MRIIGLLDRYEAIVGELFQVDLVLLIGSLTGDLTNAGIAEDIICVLSLIQSYTTNSLAVLGKKHISANVVNYILIPPKRGFIWRCHALWYISSLRY